MKLSQRLRWIERGNVAREFQQRKLNEALWAICYANHTTEAPAGYSNARWQAAVLQFAKSVPEFLKERKS